LQVRSTQASLIEAAERARCNGVVSTFHDDDFGRHLIERGNGLNGLSVRLATCRGQNQEKDDRSVHS